MKTLIITNCIANGTDKKINPSLLNLLGAATNINKHNKNNPNDNRDANDDNDNNNDVVSNVVVSGMSSDVLIIGYQLNEVCQQIANLKNVNQVLQLDHSSLDNLLVENVAKQIAEIVNNYTHILVNADSFGKNLLPRIAGILELGQISEVVEIISPSIFKKFIYAGNVLVEIESLEKIKLLSIRANNFTAISPINVCINVGINADINAPTSSAPINFLEYTNPISDKIRFVSKQIEDKSVSLDSAQIVVSGGISLGSAAAFDSHVRALAAKLNAAVGATRAAVEAGIAPNDCQVGQTGVIVAPKLYLAIGISGAVQHIAGMKDSKTVIAINTDSSAPIFEYADYGMVGDLFEIIPQLVNKL